MHLSSEERGQPSSRCGEAVKAMVRDVVGPDRVARRAGSRRDK